MSEADVGLHHEPRHVGDNEAMTTVSKRTVVLSAIAIIGLGFVGVSFYAGYKVGQALRAEPAMLPGPALEKSGAQREGSGGPSGLYSLKYY
jgi:hypothetical protein